MTFKKTTREQACMQGGELGSGKRQPAPRIKVSSCREGLSRCRILQQWWVNLNSTYRRRHPEAPALSPAGRGIFRAASRHFRARSPFDSSSLRSAFAQGRLSRRLKIGFARDDAIKRAFPV